MSIKWLKGIPSLAGLNLSDRHRLVEQSWCPLFVLSAAQMPLPINAGKLIKYLLPLISPPWISPNVNRGPLWPNPLCPMVLPRYPMVLPLYPMVLPLYPMVLPLYPMVLSLYPMVLSLCPMVLPP